MKWKAVEDSIILFKSREVGRYIFSISPESDQVEILHTCTYMHENYDTTIFLHSKASRESYGIFNQKKDFLNLLIK